MVTRIINYEYAIVKNKQPSAAEATAIQKFLTWIVTNGNELDLPGPGEFRASAAAGARISKTLIARSAAN